MGMRMKLEESEGETKGKGGRRHEREVGMK